MKLLPRNGCGWSRTVERIVESEISHLPNIIKVDEYAVGFNKTRSFYRAPVMRKISTIKQTNTRHTNI